MATKIKDSATAVKAALKLNEGIEPATKGEPNAPKEKTTSERLFPEFVTDDGAITNRPIRLIGQQPEAVAPSPAAETLSVPAQGQTPQTQPPTAPAYIKPEDLTGKMARIKVDGVEQDVPASELFKLTQLERHSNAQLMKLAQERAQLERDRQEFASRQVPAPEIQKPPKGEPPAKKPAEIEALEAKLAAMEQAMAQERALLLPQIQEAGIKRVEQMAKDRFGSEDYRSYHDKIKSEAFQEIERAKASGDPNWQRFDTDGFYFERYKEMKLRDLMAKPVTTPASTNPAAPVLQTQQGAPVVTSNTGAVVSMPTFESSGGVPSVPSESSNWQSTYQTLLARAQQQPTDENWMAVMRHKFRTDQR